MKKKEVVELPEFPLPTSGQSSDCSFHRDLVVYKGVAFKDQFHLLRIYLEQLLKQGPSPRALRSLKVTKNNYYHRCILGPLERGTRDIDVLDECQFKKLDRLALLTR